jgi:hypothetical protein
VLTLANKSPVREVVILLDCCHSGAFGQVGSLGEESNQILLRRGVSVLTASRESEAAFETGVGGVFTSLLCGALEGGAADVLGNVTIAGAYAYVDEALGAFDQRPLFKANVSQLFPLRRCQPAVSRASLRKLPEIFASDGAEPTLGPEYEPTAPEHVAAKVDVMKELQKMRAARLVEPIGCEHLYYAAMERKRVRLTPLGQHYWRLARAKRL